MNGADDFSIRFYAEVASGPGAASIATPAISQLFKVQVGTDRSSSNVPIYEWSAAWASPVTLAAGPSCYVAIVHPSDDYYFYWPNNSQDTDWYLLDGETAWRRRSFDLAFELATTDSVPELRSLVICGIAA